MVKLEIGEHNFYLDGYLHANLENVKHNVKRNDYDSFLIVAGREGYGKSTLAAQIALFLDPTYTLDRCCFTDVQFKDACVNAEKYQAVVFDETMGYLSARGAMSGFNRTLIKVMSEMRSKNLFVILCIPSFFELDKYPAMHRSTGLLHCYRRGRFGLYNYPSKQKLYLQGKKTYSYCVSANFIGNFGKYFPLDKESYEKKKQKAINDFASTQEKKSKHLLQRDYMIYDNIRRGLTTIEEEAERNDITITTIKGVVKKMAKSEGKDAKFKGNSLEE